MMTNNQPWQSGTNASHFSNAISSDTQVALSGKDAGKTDKAVSFPSLKIMEAKRYSFDDNGGGYQGL